MPKKKRPESDWKTDKMMRRLFPKKVIEKAKEVAHEHDDPEDEPATDGESDITHGTS